MSDSVLGKGLDFPYDLDRGRLATVEEEASVQAAMRMLFSTMKGQRFMLPQYGSDLSSLLFEPCDAVTASRAQVYASEAIREWIPRIRRVNVQATPDLERGAIVIRVDYVLIHDPSPRSFIYPFYLRNERT